MPEEGFTASAKSFLLAPPVRCIAEGRSEQRHVVVQVFVVNLEPDRNAIQERRAFEQPGTYEMFANIKFELVEAALQIALRDERIIRPSIAIRRCFGYQRPAIARNGIKGHSDPGSRQSGHSVENVRCEIATCRAHAFLNQKCKLTLF